MQTAQRGKEMETVTVLHMNKGVGKTSYAMNSTLQVGFYITMLFLYIYICLYAYLRQLNVHQPKLIRLILNKMNLKKSRPQALDVPATGQNYIH